METLMDWLHYLFLLVPLLYFLLALWSLLESKSNKRKGKDKDILLKQGIFVFICTLVAIGVDILILPHLIPMLPCPPLMARILTFLIVIYLIGIFVGGTELQSRSLKKNNSPTQKKKKRRR